MSMHALTIRPWRACFLMLILAVLSACGGGGDSTASNPAGGGGGPVAAADNVLTINVNRGPTGTHINAPFVSVTVCVPGTSRCQTIDQVLIDTGSYGLRLHASALSLAPDLPVVTNATGRMVGACGQFVNHYAWGALRRADVQLSGLQAANLPIQVIADADPAYAQVPSSCSSLGAAYATVNGLGANGILGIGFLAQDCGSFCTTNTISHVYYGCTSTGSCTETTLSLGKQLANPVSALPTHNNGVTLVFPSVPLGGTTYAYQGSLVFGVNTASNNQIADTAKILPTDISGQFVTTYKGVRYDGSHIDSGSNVIFFPEPTLNTLSATNDMYVPAETLALTATVESLSGTVSTDLNFWVENPHAISSTVVAAHLGARGTTSTTFTWGMPFFFGRTTHLVMNGQTVNGQTGPLWAF